MWLLLVLPLKSFASNLEASSDSLIDVELTMPMVENGYHDYFRDLLQQSLELNGHTALIHMKVDQPQKRVRQDLSSGQLSIYWMLNTNQRNETYTPIPIDLTNGLIGKRLLLIHRGAQPDYDGINNLDEFRTRDKIGALGEGWFDINVWKKNSLKHTVFSGEWRKVYKPLTKGNRGIDYFPRGANEITYDLAANPELQIERNLLLIYDRDFWFYLSPKAEKYKDIIYLSLKRAKEEGLMDTLIDKHWGEIFKELNLVNRVKLNLETPSE